MANIELTTADFATRKAISELLPSPNVIGKKINSNLYSIALIANTPKKITDWEQNFIEQNCQITSDGIEVTNEDLYKIYGHVSFAGPTGNIITIQIYVDGQLYCECYPNIETTSGKEISLNLFDAAELSVGSEIVLYLESDKDVTLTIYRQKLLLVN